MSNYYYHFSTGKNTESIIDNGLKKSNGGVFLASSLEGALAFANIYVTPDENEEVTVFVYRIDGDKLDQSNLSVSHDHNRKFIPVDAYIYFDDIPKEFITVEEAYTFDNKPKIEIKYKTVSGEIEKREVNKEHYYGFLADIAEFSDDKHIKEKEVYSVGDIEDFNSYLDSFHGVQYDFEGITDIEE